MFRTVADFIKAAEEERQMTLKIFGSLTPESLGQEVASGHRSIARLAWHIAACNPGMASEAGLKLEGTPPAYESMPPADLATIIAEYEKWTALGMETIKGQWTDDMLAEETPMYGESWTRGFTLFCMLLHESHHRGQMTVLMRQAGLKVPGIYGPALEEWGQYGMEVPPGA